MNPIVFLSIDGVIATRDGVDDALKTKGETHDKNGLIYFCPKACEHVSKLIEHYSADVVLYSSWSTNFKNIDDTKKFFKSRGLNWNIVDKTNNVLTRWFSKNGTPEKFVVLTTDDTLLDILPNNTILTEESHGFADRKAYRKAMNSFKKTSLPIVEKDKTPKSELF